MYRAGIEVLLLPYSYNSTGGQTTMVNSLKWELVRKCKDFSKTTMLYVCFYTNQNKHEIDIHLIHDCKSQLDIVY